MIPEEIVERFIAWSVDDVYNHWELFALNASIAAYDFALARARKESDDRTEQLKAFIEDLVEAHELKAKGSTKVPRWNSEGKIVYIPKGEIKDWR